jgi:hypothetical protein
MTIRLRGITWNHTRRYLPMVATAQRFAEIIPGFDVAWEKSHLKSFSEDPVVRLADGFDLLVVDHSSLGEIVERGLLVPLDEHCKVFWTILKTIRWQIIGIINGRTISGPGDAAAQWCPALGFARTAQDSRPQDRKS